MADNDWRTDIQVHFPDWGTDAWKAEWAARPVPAAVGDEIVGQVIARTQFGVWVDANLGTPALLEVVRMAAAGASPIHFEDYPVLGAEIRAMVMCVGDHGEVSLTQQDGAVLELLGG